MVLTDPIADLLNRMRNALLARHASTSIPFSTIKLEIIKIIKSGGYIKGYKVFDREGKKDIRVYLKYDAQNNGIIKGLRRISSPGRRVYVTKDKVPRVLGGLGMAVLSTTKGIMADGTCRQENVGGEVLCYIW